MTEIEEKVLEELGIGYGRLLNGKIAVLPEERRILKAITLTEKLKDKEWSEFVKRDIERREKNFKDKCEKEKKEHFEAGKRIGTTLGLRKCEEKLTIIKQKVEGLRKKAKEWVWYKGSDEQKALGLLDDVLKLLEAKG